MDDPKKKGLDMDFQNAETIHASVPMTKKEFEKLNHYCQQTGEAAAARCFSHGLFVPAVPAWLEV